MRLFVLLAGCGLVAGSIGCVKAQMAVEKSAMNQMAKQKWSSARSRLDKAMSKDSAHVGAAYTLALYYFHTNNPDYNLDSASASLNRSRNWYPSVPSRERERLAKIPIDSTTFRMLRQRIDSAGFERAKQLNTEKSYSDFLRDFPESKDSILAVELRYEAAYVDALKLNTHEAFASYLSRYPNTTRKAEAKAKYEWLLYETKTKDKRLRSYKSFLSEYPETTYRMEVEQHIFHASTATGSVESFQQYLQEYPTSAMAATATDVLFHLAEELMPTAIGQLVAENDSLRQIIDLNRPYLVPFLSGDGFGFMDNTGRRIIEPRAVDLDATYRCGGLNEDVLVLGDELVARNNAVIFRGNIEEVDDIGYGYLLVYTDTCASLIHKSGRRLSVPCIRDARIIGRRFLGVQTDSMWRLYTLAMHPIPVSKVHDVKEANGLIGLKRLDGWSLYTPDQLANTLDQQPLPASGTYDEIGPWSQGLIYVRKAEEQGLMSSTMEMIVPMKEHTFSREFFGTMIKTSAGYTVFPTDGKPGETFPSVSVANPRVAVKTIQGWRLYNYHTHTFQTPSYDTITFAGFFPIGVRGDTLTIYFKEKSITTSTREFGFVPGKDSLAFLWLADGDRRTLYDGHGAVLFTAAFDKLSYGDKGVFVLSKKEKKGMFRLDGTSILPIEYDAIGDAVGSWVPTLKSMKFGLYDLKTGREIKPSYDKNLQRYNDQLAVAYKGGKYGFINSENKVQGKFEYDEVVYWNDSAALARKDSRWAVIDVNSRLPLVEGIKEYRLVSNTAEEKVAIIHKDNQYGVISNTRGFVLPATFTDIVNIGTKEDPLYFAEKNVEEASIFVVIYYDSSGTLIHRQAFDEDQYDRVYCSDN